MSTWKRAFWLAKFELKESKLNFLFLFLFFPFIILGVSSTFSSYLEANFVGIDIFFILLFTFAATWTKPKHFQIQQMNDELVASPAIFMLQQLPITTEVIIKSRFIIYFIYSLPIQILLLISLYVLTPSLKDMIGIGLYVVFAIIWLSFSIYMGGMVPASDAGDRATQRKVAVYGVLMVIAAIAFFTFFHVVSDYGIVQWTLIFAKKWPILSSVLSIILAFFGLNYWQSYMKKVMKKIDYL